MSKHIQDIVAIIEYIRERYKRPDEDRSIKQLRIDGTKLQAEERGRTYKTILDAYERALDPDIPTVDDFDELLEDHFLNGSEQLKNILLNHPKTDSSDVELINIAFDAPLGADALLAQEFGYHQDEREFLEGKERLKLHRRRERNSWLVQYTKKKWNLEHQHRVPCSVCSFRFAERYGWLGQGYIEAHHIVPISSLTQEILVNPLDLVPVCSNCHAILHSARPPLTVDELHYRLLK